jgi:hypothetical protein
MVTAVVAMLAMAALFVVFALLRPAERSGGGCGACDHAERCGGDGCSIPDESWRTQR